MNLLFSQHPIITNDLKSVLNPFPLIFQVLPLLVEKFSFEEQASLVWQFLCSIPVNMMAEFLPWLSASVSSDERQEMRSCLCKVIPEEKLLQQVTFSVTKVHSVL